MQNGYALQRIRTKRSTLTCCSAATHTRTAKPNALKIMQEMSVAATVPGGQQMTVNVNGQQMSVQVPMGIQPGQNFSFQTAAPAQMAQPVQAMSPMMMVVPPTKMRAPKKQAQPPA